MSQSNRFSTNTLYRFVFHSRLVKACVVFLFASILLQPVSIAFAEESDLPEPDIRESTEQEIVVENDPEVEEVTDLETASSADEVEDVDLEVVPEPDEINNTELAEEIVEDATSTTPRVSGGEEVVTDSAGESGATNAPSASHASGTPSEGAETTNSAPASSTPLFASTTEPTGILSSTSSVSVASTSVTNTSSAATPSASSEAAPESDETADSSSSENYSATTTTVADATNDDGPNSEFKATTSASATAPVVIESQNITRNNTNFYQFGREDCVSVGDGSYYCGATTESTTPENDFFAAPDAEGDMEIFVSMNGETTQITFNQFEDKAPYYDGMSESLVWHRLIDDRYQIISYDLTSGEEEQITTGSVNNMEPARFGGITVWQRWVTNNWEIILFDGLQERQLTDSIAHDVSPSVRGEHVMWTTTVQPGGQKLAVYDLETRETMMIDDADGTAASNPRVVLLYDKQYDNGDIVTRGFDFKTGQIIPLGAVPKELPEELPESDQTGETRALIQQKPTVAREEFSEPEDTPVGPFDNNTNATASSSGATTSAAAIETAVEETDLTLVIPPLSTETESGSTTESASTVETVIPDLIIQPMASTSDAGQ